MIRRRQRRQAEEDNFQALRPVPVVVQRAYGITEWLDAHSDPVRLHPKLYNPYALCVELDLTCCSHAPLVVPMGSQHALHGIFSASL